MIATAILLLVGFIIPIVLLIKMEIFTKDD